MTITEESRITLPTRDEIVQRYERDYQLRNPGALVGPSTAPGIDARVQADIMLPVYAEARRAGDAVDIENLAGTMLESEATRLGLPGRLPAVGASGDVGVTTSIGGVTIVSGSQLVEPSTGLRYALVTTAVYETGDLVPIVGIDTGPSSNQLEGKILQWVAPGAGLGPNATVLAQADGTGLTGGRDEETDPEIRLRIYAESANPAASGNSADYRRKMIETPGVSVQAGFCHPCILGPGTKAILFTTRATSSATSRIPTGSQIATVRNYVVSKMPADDSVFACTIDDEPTDMILRIRWKRGSLGWTDTIPWPVYDAGNPFVVDASPAPTSTTFTISTTMSSPPAPSAGKTIAFFDEVNRVFSRKKILSVTGTGPWDIVCDTTFSATDAFVPPAGAQAMPWTGLMAPSLDEERCPLVEALLDQFALLGPGEQVSSYVDASGARERRDPTPSEAWPMDLSGRVLTSLFAVPNVDELQVATPTLPLSPSVGTPGVSSRMLVLGELVIFAL